MTTEQHEAAKRVLRDIGELEAAKFYVSRLRDDVSGIGNHLPAGSRAKITRLFEQFYDGCMAVIAEDRDARDKEFQAI